MYTEINKFVFWSENSKTLKSYATVILNEFHVSIQALLHKSRGHTKNLTLYSSISI